MEVNYFKILYWFCHTSTWICHRYILVPHPEPLSLLPPYTIPLGPLSAPAPSILYHASNLDWWFISYMILYMFENLSPSSLCLSKAVVPFSDPTFSLIPSSSVYKSGSQWHNQSQCAIRKKMPLSLHLTFISLPQRLWTKRFFLLFRTFSTAQGTYNQSQGTGKPTVARGIGCHQKRDLF